MSEDVREIYPEYETTGVKEKRILIELYTSSILNGFSQEDFLDALKIANRVVNRVTDRLTKE